MQPEEVNANNLWILSDRCTTSYRSDCILSACSIDSVHPKSEHDGEKRDVYETARTA